MGSEEAFSWKKFLSGLISPLNFAKSFVSMVQICIIVLTIAAVVFAGYFVWQKAKPKQKAPTPPVTVESNTGTIHSSTDDNRRKLCFLSLCF